MQWRPQLSQHEPDLFDAAIDVGAGASRRRLLENLFLGDTSAARLALTTVPLVLFGAWLLLAPGRMLSREMTWDLMVNLAGAWHLHSGHLPHADYHDPLGSLYYRLTQWGFLIVGPSPLAFLVGQAFFLVPAFAAALVAATRRLSPMPATVFVVYAALLVLMPANLGDQLNAYTFAMAYNRWGWSVLTTIGLVLFVAPRAGRSAPRLEPVMCGLLMVILLYLKVTFALAALAAVALGLSISPHVRAERRAWAVVIAVVIAIAAAPYNTAYWSDIWHSATGGYLRASLLAHVGAVLNNKAEYALLGASVLALVWLWLRGHAAMHTVLLGGGAVGIGTFALSQNAQQRDIPLGIVIAYLLYEAIRRQHARTRMGGTTEVLVALTAVMIWPLLSLLAVTTTLVGYHRAAQRDTAVLTVDSTNLRGLAAPVDTNDVAKALATVDLPYSLRSTSREPPMLQQLTQFQYVQTLMEAAALFASGEHGQAKILVLDQVNPLPFMLGYPPPRGGPLWMLREARPLPAETVFGDVDIVLIPKFSTYAQSTAFALTTYGDYLSAHFPVQEQSPSWTILSRQAAARPG